MTGVVRLEAAKLRLCADNTAPAAGPCLTRMARAIEMVGQDGFHAALADLCQHASGYDSCFVTAYFSDHPPVQLFSNLASKDGQATIAPYLDFAYLLDPFFALFQRGTGDAVVSLEDCAPDDFLTSDYYRTFYADTGLLDETSIFVSFGKNAALMLSLGSRVRGHRLSPDGRAALNALLPCVAALCRRHWPRLDPDCARGTGRIGQHLEKSFQRFGTSVLSAREAEIVRLILQGHSSKSIARELGNSPETVKVHRKRIHAKLDIASQGELFSLFLDALSHTPPNATADPLTYLNRQVSEF